MTGYLPLIEISGDAAIVRFHSMLDPGLLRDLQLDYNIASAVLTIRELVGDDWSPESVELTRQKPSNPAAWTDFFRCPVRFGADESLVLFDRSDLSLKLAFEVSGPAPQIAAEGSVPIDFVQLVDREIIRNLSRGVADVTMVSASMRISSRTLQRRLVQAGTSYQERLDEIRKTWASQYLTHHRQMSLTELSQLLGFGDLSTSSCRFKRWFGVSPRQWQKSQSVLS